MSTKGLVESDPFDNLVVEDSPSQNRKKFTPG